MQAFLESRQRHHIVRSIKYCEKLASDYALLFGAKALETVLQSIKFSRQHEVAGQSDPLVLKAVSASAILQAYLDVSSEARDFFGEGHTLSADWDKSCTFHEFENKRAVAIAQLRAHLRSKPNKGRLEALVPQENPGALDSVPLQEGQVSLSPSTAPPPRASSSPSPSILTPSARIPKS